jgi:hypothetical protein
MADLERTITDLLREKRELDHLIRVLEYLEIRQAVALETPEPVLRAHSRPPLVEKPVSRRGRKRMAPEERFQVSQRMRTYWARQRAARSAGEGTA